MTANIEKNGTTLFVTVEGRLDTMSSPELEEQALRTLRWILKILCIYQVQD